MTNDPEAADGVAEAQELIAEAIDTLAVLYPARESEEMKSAWFKWLRDLLEERAPMIQADLDDDEERGEA